MLRRGAAAWLALLVLLCALSVSACRGEQPAPGASPSQPDPTVTFSPLPPPPSAPTATAGKPRQYSYSIVRVYPHDPQAFTQGLVYHGGFLYEGTGLNGKSSLRRVELETGKVVQRLDLPAQYFGEGIALSGDRIVQLTWRSGVGFIYDRETFRLLSEFYYSTEGWGITHDGARFIMSDGTAVLRFLDAVSLNVTGQVTVTDGGAPVPRLNEMEFIGGKVFANVWQTDRIAIIDPASGRVEGWVDLAGLLQSQGPAGTPDVLNGIAYDAAGDRLFVTGKLWHRLFEIKLNEVNG